MDGRSVLLAKLPFQIEEPHKQSLLLSPSLKHILWVNHSKVILYSLSKQSDYEHKGACDIWTQTFLQVESILFSDDGKQFAIINDFQPKKINVYNITEQAVIKESETFIKDIKQSLSSASRSDENVCDSPAITAESEILLVYLHKSQLILYSSGSLASFRLSASECLQNYFVNLASEITCFHFNTNFFYCLDGSGIVYLYILESGKLVGVYDIYKALPKNLSFCRLCINTSGTQVALLGTFNHVYILDISSATLAPAFASQKQSARGSSSSVSSFKTSTSKTSSYSRGESLKREATNKKIVSIANGSAANTSWLGYLEKLRNRKTNKMGKVEECDSFVCIRDIPNIYIIHTLHFCQDTLGIWASHRDKSSDGFYRVYDKTSGQLESADILAPDTRVISLEALSVSLDLFLQSSNLCLPLGLISRDTLVQKMVGGENESVVDEMIGHAVLPLPLLKEGLTHFQLDMVRLALNLHTQGFKSKLSEEAGSVNELIESTKQLFETIHMVVGVSDSRGQWNQQVQRLGLTHANTLLSLLLFPSAQVDLQVEILQHVILLRRGEPVNSVDLPVIPQWASWLPLSDEEVFLHSISSLPLVHCFLALHRCWTEKDLQSERFYNTVQRICTNMLQEKNLDQATELLTKVKLDPKKELRALCLKCQDPSLRDYLVTNKISELNAEHYNAWQFLTFVETVLTNYSHYFPRFSESPLKILDVLSFCQNDKSNIVLDLYFSTGEPNLETHLDKNACWDYLLAHNYTEGIIAWLGLKSSDSKFAWPLQLFFQWKIEQPMVDRVLSSDCTDLTKHLVCNRLAVSGILTSFEKSDPKRLVLRLAFSEVFPDVKAALNQATANLSYTQFSELMLQHAIENNLVDLAVKSNLSEINSENDCPAWLRLLKLHAEAGKTWEHSAVAEAVQETTQYLATLESVEPSLYLKQHPIVAVVTDILKDQDICQLHSHVSPLLAASVSVSGHPQDDITLYSVLAHTVPFHTDNIFQYQINSKKNSHLPNFCNENLSLRYGIQYLVGFKEFLKQGRPGSALLSVLQKGRFSVRKKTAVNCAHGLALHNAGNSTVTTACVAFAELLGQDSSLLRTHVATARTLVGHISDTKLKENLLYLVQGKEDKASALLSELEDFLLDKWTTNSCSVLTCLQDFHLAVRLSACHGLPAPLALFKHSLQTNNWLVFVLAAQLFQYPLSRVQEISLSVKHEMSKHLYHALHSSTRHPTENITTKAFEPKTNLFSSLAHLGTDPEALFTFSRQLNSSALALLASSMQGVPVETGLSMWLIASLTPEDALQCPNSLWNTDAITQLLELVVRQGYFYTLAHGFFIFQPVNPFCVLAKFFIESVVERKFKESVKSLKQFMAEFSNLTNERKKESSFLMNKSWVAVTAYRMACTALAFCFPSGYLRRCFLQTLCEAQFSDIHEEAQSLSLLLRLSECLANTSLQIDWKRLCLQQDTSQLPELLNGLIEQHLFDTAFKYAYIAGLPQNLILVTQWSELALTDERKERDFWKRCDQAFQQANIDPEVAVSLYRDQAAATDDLHEKYVLLKFALNWMCKASSSNEDIIRLRIELYMTCLQEKFKIEAITEGVVPATLHCMSESLELTPIQSPPQLSGSQCHRLNDIIHQLLLVGDIHTAFQLQALFNHTNQDCELLLACMRLAEGVIDVSQLPSRIQEYLTLDEAMRRPKMAFTSPLPKMRFQNCMLQSDIQSILNALYALQAHQTSATALFGHIICGFKASVALNCHYKELMLDPEPLNRLLPRHDFDVAVSLLNLASLTRSECTQYLCSQIVAVLSSEPVDRKFVLWSCDLENEFSCILDMSGSALMLGNLLLASDPPTTPSSSPAIHRQVVELLILAHQCFTRVCHMEGISSVLNFCRSTVNRLLDSCQWPLMVRLLTGIGRHTEMNYIFQILKENDQFEFLLGKGLDKPQLMSATLEFVRCDKELFSLVAHHFSMYSELAALYEGEARQELDRVDKREGALVISAHNRVCLQTAMSKFTDATEHYMQAKKMKCGVSSIQQAELIAVQLSLLNNATETSVTCLISLTNAQALDLVNTTLSCEQAHIVASAYNVSVDWSAALYNNCVLRGDTSYLNTWTTHHQLNKTVVQDVVRRFQSERETNSKTEVNMKWFVSSVGLLDVKYRVASQLGFKDILQSLLNSPDMAYLKDTVWQQGFKKQIV